MERLKSLASQLVGTPTPHPFDPLTAAEIERASSVVRREKGATMEDGRMAFNAISLWQPRKEAMLAWLDATSDQQKEALRPPRVADCVVVGARSTVFDALVDLKAEKVIKWQLTDNVQPLVRVSSAGECG